MERLVCPSLHPAGWWFLYTNTHPMPQDPADDTKQVSTDCYARF